MLVNELELNCNYSKLGVSKLQVIGSGVSGIGIAIAADRLHKINQLFNLGVTFIDRESLIDNLVGNGINYYINSNSPALDFLSEIRSDGFFQEVLCSPIAKKIRSYNERNLPLNLVAKFLNILGMHVYNHLKQNSHSQFLLNSNVKCLKLDREGYFTSILEDGVELCRSQAVVLANGAEQRRIQFSEEGSGYAQEKLILSATSILRCQNIIELFKILKDRTPSNFVIIGSSHSAFSTACKLKSILTPSIKSFKIHIFSKKQIQLYFPNLNEALSFGLKLENLKNSIHPETGEINRFTGLRGQAKDLYIKIVSNQESQVTLNKFNESFELELRNLDSVIIEAIGYESRKITLLDSNNREIKFSYKFNKIEVDNMCRILDNEKSVIPGLFGLGLGYPHRNSLTENFYEEVAVNLFYSRDVLSIIKQIL